jgi:beta-glucosidase
VNSIPAFSACGASAGYRRAPTVFPQAIGLAATWNAPLLHQVVTAIGTEGRVHYEQSVAAGRHGMFEGLEFRTPNINIFRDPRWGRGQEIYGEDPFLTGRTAVAYVAGMQGGNPK